MRFTTIAHARHDLMSPLSEATMDRLLAALRVRPGDSVLDLGCGNGAMLLRLVATCPHAEALGIDRNPAMIERAQARSAATDPGGRVRWRCGDAGDLAAPGRPVDVVLCVGATGVFGGYAGTLAALHRLLVPGGRALIGEGIWSREPEQAYLDLLGAPREEMAPAAETLEAARQAGFEVVDHAESTPEEWDAYEGLYADTMEAWCADHPADPDAPAFRERIRRWREGYECWGRGTLGFLSMVLRR